MGSTRNSKGAYSKSEAEPYHEKLKLLRARMVGDTNYLADSALKRTRSEAAGDLSKMPIHMADIGSDNYEQEFSLNLLAAEQVTLAEIDSALARIESGEYGACVECGQRIKKSRLNAIPFTHYCIDCASERDQESRG
ncbi:transcriptional regulator [Blastopirellula marina]|uniref:Transcriptional regulator n=1 Tax=Blastopirellula marina TaxID=124 RepID=A0A2S8G4D4_9BACT|nr:MULTISPECIES: TraR/DksA family transcriptional regulator [Pirellulaceae]PQO39150.1 transcriptional regulator [Blastopirellula marina]RCS55458.1 TraR/DksA family transcriptional regulator [Bremerella cremea]